MISSRSVLSAVANGDEMLIRGRYTDEVARFLKTLPKCRWDRRANAHRCLMTRAAAWRMVSTAPDGCVVEADPLIRSTAGKFLTSPFRRGDFSQPSLRVFDSWRHQAEATNFVAAGDAAMLSMRMGTGKSKVVVDTVVNQGMGRVLILCPASVRGVWRREFATFAATPIEPLVLDRGTVKRKPEDAERHLMLSQARGECAVVVINYESAWREPFGKWALSQTWDAVILDESHRIKGHAGKASKFCGELTRRAGRRLCLTGTPMPHSPMDVFAQYRFLDPGIYGTSYVGFRARYAKTGHFGADHIVGFQHLDELSELMSYLTFEVGDEVLDLPERTERQISIEFEPKSRRVYGSMRDEMIAEVNDGVITAANGLAKLIRLRQITSGFVKTEDGETDLGGEKSAALGDLLEDLGGDEPVVVFCEFTRELDQVRRLAESMGREYGELSGRRSDLTDRATMPEGVDVMAVNTRAGGAGIDLTRARHCVYYSLPWSLGDYEQSMARVHRPGQTRSTCFHYLVVDDSTDAVVMSALSRRRNVVESVLESLRASIASAQ